MLSRTVELCHQPVTCCPDHRDAVAESCGAIALTVIDILHWLVHVRGSLVKFAGAPRADPSSASDSDDSGRNPLVRSRLPWMSA